MCFSATVNFVGAESGSGRHRHIHKGEASARTAFRRAAHAIRRSPVHRGICLAGIGWDSFACGGARHGRGLYALCAGAPPLFCCRQACCCSSQREEPQADAAVPRARRSNYALYFVGLTAFPLQLFVKGNSIAYINQATDNTGVASLSVIATWLVLFSKIKMMVIFGVANLAVLLVVMEFKRYAFTSLWCAYAEVASVIILAYFWRRGAERPSSPRSKANLKLLCPSDRQAGTQRGPDARDLGCHGCSSCLSWV